jgi:Flp pilus assembly protein TadG
MQLTLLRRERGQDLVEFALVLLILVPLLFGIMEFGIVIFSYNTISGAARDGARYGAVCLSTHAYTPCSTSAVEAKVKERALGLTNVIPKASTTAVPGNIQVAVSYKVNSIAGIIIGSQGITLKAVSTMRIEQ